MNKNNLPTNFKDWVKWLLGINWREEKDCPHPKCRIRAVQDEFVSPMYYECLDCGFIGWC